MRVELHGAGKRFDKAAMQAIFARTRDAAYEQRLKAAYPIHPEVFDRLYTDWSTLVKFQRTRGVLRLMAAVIHSLWEKGDKNPLIMPANVSIDDPRVQFELTRYLSDNWVPVIGAAKAQGVLPTFLAASSLTVGQIWTTIIGFTLLYGTLAVIEVRLMIAMIRKGQQSGAFAADRDAKPLAHQALASLLGMLVMIRSRPEEEFLTAVRDGFLKSLT